MNQEQRKFRKVMRQRAHHRKYLADKRRVRLTGMRVRMGDGRMATVRMVKAVPPAAKSSPSVAQRVRRSINFG